MSFPCENANLNAYVHCLIRNDGVPGVAEAICVDETIGNSYNGT